MGAIWISDGKDFRQVKRWYGGTGTGRVIGNVVYEWDGAAWVSLWERSTTPPPAPILVVDLKPGTRNVFNVTLTMPGSNATGDFKKAVVKVGINKTPNPPGIEDGTYYKERQDAEEWSNWFSDQVLDGGDIAINSTDTKEFPSPYQLSVSVPLNVPVTFSAWVGNEYGNWSAVATTTKYSLKASDPPAGGVTYVTVVAPLDFDDYEHDADNWVYRGKMVSGVRKYGTPSWVRASTNPSWWSHTGGSTHRQTYLWFGSNLRKVLSTAFTITKVEMAFKRRYDTLSNTSGGKNVTPAESFGRKSGVQVRVWACSQAHQSDTGLGSTSHLVGSSDSVLKFGDFPVGTTKKVTIPARTYEKMISGKGSAYSLCFYNATSDGSNTDYWSLSWAMPGVYGSGTGAAKWNKIDLSGHLVVTWVGYYGNPWPEADPSHPNFKPVGVTEW